jgi:hypothetical protein
MRVEGMRCQILVKEALTDQMIEAGASVVQNLNGGQFLVDAAVWLYLSDANRWRLLLATPEVHTEGPLKAYKRLLRAFGNAAMHGLTIEDVSVIDSRDPLIRLLRGAMKTDRSGRGIRFSRTTIKGQFIDDAYIYRTAA